MDRDPDFRVAELKVWIHRRQYENADEYWDANWLNITARCTSGGAKVEISGPVLHLSEVVGFLRECEVLYERVKGEATLGCMEPNLHLSLHTTDSLGSIEAVIAITPDHLNEEHSFKFQIDQSHLPFIIRGLKKVLAEFPVRGRPS